MTTEIKTESLSSGVVLPRQYEVGKRVYLISPKENAVCVTPDPSKRDLWLHVPMWTAVEIEHDTYQTGSQPEHLTTAITIRIS